MRFSRRLTPFLPPLVFLLSMAAILAGVPFLFTKLGGSPTATVGAGLALLILPISVLISLKGEGKAIRFRQLRSWVSGIYTLIMLLMAATLLDRAIRDLIYQTEDRIALARIEGSFKYLSRNLEDFLAVGELAIGPMV